MSRCLICYDELPEGVVDYHPRCSQRLFGSHKPPQLSFDRDSISELATEVIRSQTTLTGVQPKLSLDINRGTRGEPDRLTVVGLWGRYILKPQSDAYRNLPELEDVTMHLAEMAKIDVVPHGLIRMADGELSYITQRIDRTDTGQKLPMEDFCQISNRLTEHKYKGSYEQIAKLLKAYSNRPTFDLLVYWEVVLFSWLVGNSDMHLKNFSLYRPQQSRGYQLTPAYDLLATKLVLPEDKEELALTLSGKKSNLRGDLFVKAMQNSGISNKVIENTFSKLRQMSGKWFEFIQKSFLLDDLKEALQELIEHNLSKL